MTEFTVKEVTVFRVVTFLNDVTPKYNFLGICEIFNITNSAVQIWTAKCDLNKE